MQITPRLAGMIGLLAILPVIAFGVFRTWWAGLITLVNVIVISIALYLLFSPTEGESHGGHGENGAGAASDEAL
ncbi:hypothetical protein DVK02_14575 [Halobellus sp. Atlit-31R]|nr:hypothetical protein DVK02_14575 [Halobellus sp. Atlit-31R]